MSRILLVILLVGCGSTPPGSGTNAASGTSDDVAVPADEGPVGPDLFPDTEADDSTALDDDDGLDVPEDTPVVPDVAPVADIPAVEDMLALEDVSAVDDVPAVEDIPAVDEVPAVEDVAPVEDATVVEEDTGPVGPEPLWLLSIDNGPHLLQRIDVETGAGTDLCTLTSAANYPSLTFSRSNLLFASRGGVALDVIDPCTCEVTEVGDYGIWSGVNGITSDKAVGLFGVASSQDDLITIFPMSGTGTKVGDLGVNFGTGGATWSDSLGALYAINGNTDSLYIIDPLTGAATLVVALSMTFGTVGIELHPANDTIYACTSNAMLRKIDPVTGVVIEIGPMGQSGSCTNLAAPYNPVPCVAP